MAGKQKKLEVKVVLVDGVTAATKRITGAIGKFVKGIVKGFGSAIKTVFSLKSAIIGLTGAFGLLFGAVAALGPAAEMERLRVTLKSIVKDADIAAFAFERMRKFAAESPLRTADALGAFVQLQAANVLDAESVVKDLANLAITFNRSMSDVTAAFINPQQESLVRLGINIRRVAGGLATIVGKDFRESVKNVEEEIRGAILRLIQQNYGDALKEAGQTFTNRMAVLKSAIFDFAADVGDVFLPTAKKIADFMSDSLNANRKLAKDIAGNLEKSLKELFKIMGDENHKGMIKIRDGFVNLMKDMLNIMVHAAPSFGDALAFGIVGGLENIDLRGERLTKQLKLKFQLSNQEELLRQYADIQGEKTPKRQEGDVPARPGILADEVAAAQVARRLDHQQRMARLKTVDASLAKNMAGVKKTVDRLAELDDAIAMHSKLLLDMMTGSFLEGLTKLTTQWALKVDPMIGSVKKIVEGSAEVLEDVGKAVAPVIDKAALALREERAFLRGKLGDAQRAATLKAGTAAAEITKMLGRTARQEYEEGMRLLERAQNTKIAGLTKELRLQLQLAGLQHLLPGPPPKPRHRGMGRYGRQGSDPDKISGRWTDSPQRHATGEPYRSTRDAGLISEDVAERFKKEIELKYRKALFAESQKLIQAKKDLIVLLRDEEIAQAKLRGDFAGFGIGIQDFVKQSSDGFKNWRDVGVQTAQVVTSNFATAITALVTGARSVKGAFKDMAIGVLQDIQSIISRLIAMRLVSSLLGADFVSGKGGIGGFIGKLLFDEGGIARGPGLIAIGPGVDEAMIPLNAAKRTGGLSSAMGAIGGGGVAMTNQFSFTVKSWDSEDVQRFFDGEGGAMVVTKLNDALVEDTSVRERVKTISNGF